MTSLYWCPAAIVAVTIIVLSHQSSLPPAASMVPDYALHVSEYFVFGLTLAFGQTQGFRRSLSRAAAVGLWLGLILFAVSDEFHQSFIANRQAQASDLISDSVGGLGALVCCWWYGRRERE